MSIHDSVSETQTAPAAAPSTSPTEGDVSPEMLAQRRTVAVDQQIVSVDTNVQSNISHRQEQVDRLAAAAAARNASPELAKDPEFLDSIFDHYESAQANGKGWFTAGFDALLFAITTGTGKLTDMIGGWLGREPAAKTALATQPARPTPAVANANAQAPSSSTAPAVTAAPVLKGLGASAKKQLDKALEKNPTWLNFAKEAYEKFKIKPSVQFAFARFESSFNHNAFHDDPKRENDRVEGLGQFWGPTWDRFMAANSEFQGASRTDPRASFHAMAWYASQNAKECGIDVNAPDAPARLYEAHHEGAGGYKNLRAFREGRIATARIPTAYAGKAFPDFGVAHVGTYADYAKLITAMSSRMQTVADVYTVYDVQS